MEQEKWSDFDSEFYKQGSETCRNYSRLTMEVRTLSQKVLIGSVIAISAASLGDETLTKEPLNEISEFFGVILLTASIVLGCFSLSLALVDWHYQSAFTAIRNALAKMESENGGPWSAHKLVRTERNDFFASYFPFMLLWLVGMLTFVTVSKFAIEKLLELWLVGVAVFAANIGVFLYIYRNQGDLERAEESTEGCKNQNGDAT